MCLLLHHRRRCTAARSRDVVHELETSLVYSWWCQCMLLRVMQGVRRRKERMRRSPSRKFHQMEVYSSLAHSSCGRNRNRQVLKACERIKHKYLYAPPPKVHLGVLNDAP